MGLTWSTSIGAPPVMSTASSRPMPRPWEAPWMDLAFGHHEDRTPSHETREAAMAAFAKSSRRQ
jgi:hypothetical protein